MTSSGELDYGNVSILRKVAITASDPNQPAGQRRCRGKERKLLILSRDLEFGKADMTALPAILFS